MYRRKRSRRRHVGRIKSRRRRGKTLKRYGSSRGGIRL